MIEIPRPPFTLLGRKLESMCRKALYEFKLLEGVDKLALALSGGKDSLTLLILLKAILGKGFPEIPIVAIHVTGAFSCGPSVQGEYLRKVCGALDVEMITCESKQKLETLQCYSCSRERRRLIFEAAKGAGATTIAFGHHRDDSIQTLMMNLLHKGEFAANLPKVEMVDYGVTLIRPLIYISEIDIKKFASLHGFARILCQCPVGQHSMRRKVDDLLGQIEEIFPGVRHNLSLASMKYGSQKANERATCKDQMNS